MRTWFSLEEITTSSAVSYVEIIHFPHSIWVRRRGQCLLHSPVRLPYPSCSVFIRTARNTLFLGFRSTPPLLPPLLFRLLHRILSSPSLQIWHSLVWSQTLLSLYILSLKFLIQSHSINYHVFASESQIFTSCPKLSSRFQIYISYYSPSSCISHRFLKFNTFITKLIFFSRNLCFLSQMLHHHPASQYWKLRDTLTLLFPSPSSIPGAKIPFFLGISQIYFPNISRNIPFSLLLD